MKFVTKIIIIIFLSTVYGCTYDVPKIYPASSELYKMAWDMRNAVLNEDIDFLMKHVHSTGLYFVDDVYSYAEIDKLIRDKNSWLYKHLFVGNKSVKTYFQKAKNIKVIVYERDLDAILISYQSSNFEAIEWMESCFIKIDGKWYFDGIFSCE